MNIDIEKIKQRFSEINEAMNEIKKLVSISPDEFWKDKRNIAALKYYLILMIEAVGSVCTHILAKKFNRAVSTLSECFEFMEKEGILNKNLTERIKNISKFRNKLIHRYWEIEDEIILKYAKEDINDFFDFMKEIEKYITKEE
jgi:uncharacterized protein YutE (UPF0331/DUF86 family)